MSVTVIKAVGLAMSTFADTAPDKDHPQRDPGGTARTQPGRDAFLARFEHEVDPDGQLTPEERSRRAESLRKAYFARLALKSAQARRKAS